MTPAPAELIGLHLTHRYSTAEQRPALDDVSIGFTPGSSASVVGPSGSGKTTLLHLLAGVLLPTQGDVLWRGRDLRKASDAERSTLRRSQFGFVFQSGQLLPELPAVENVALPLLLGGMARGQATDRAAVLLGKVGLSGLEKRRPGEMSGGQLQRCAVARALVGNPGVVFADEPTGALDQTTGQQTMDLLVAATQSMGAALVVITHDHAVAQRCGRIVQMRDGRIVDDSAPVAVVGAERAEFAGVAR